MIFVSIILVTMCLEIGASDRTAQDRPEQLSQAPDEKRHRTEESKQTADARKQAERDLKRLQEHTRPNIAGIKASLPRGIQQEIVDMIVCYKLGNWDARVAYQNGLIKFDPERLITIYTALEDMTIKLANGKKEIVTPAWLFDMTAEQQALVQPSSIVQYLLDLDDQGKFYARNAALCKETLDLAHDNQLAQHAPRRLNIPYRPAQPLSLYQAPSNHALQAPTARQAQRHHSESDDDTDADILDAIRERINDLSACMADKYQPNRIKDSARQEIQELKQREQALIAKRR